MSKVAIVGDPSGTGTFTISAPNGNTDRTLVLPDEAGTIITTAGVPASAMPAGSVLQVVQDIGDTDPETYTTSQSFVASGSYANITPLYASSKILVIVSGGFMSVNNAGNYGHWTVYRNGSAVFPHEARCGVVAHNSVIAYTAFDSPNTTSSIQYRLYIRSNNGGGIQTGNHASTSCRVTLMEIAA